MTFDPNRIRALLFDVGGTVFDWHGGTRREFETLAAERGAKGLDCSEVANRWHEHSFAVMDEVRRGDRPWMNIEEMRRIALDDLTARFPALHLTQADANRLNGAWYRLNVWPDAVRGIAHLRKHYLCVTLTVQSFASIAASSKANGLVWDGILSCEFLGVYKPSLESYRAGARLVGCRPEECLMVGAHPEDIAPAQRAGLSAAYVHRPMEQGHADSGRIFPRAEFEVSARDLEDLAAQLGC